MQGEEHPSAISALLKLSTRSITLPVQYPTPDLKYLNLHAARRRAQSVARRTQALLDRVSYRKVNKTFSRHMLRLQRRQWNQFCASLDFRFSSPRMWRTVESLIAPPATMQPVAGLAIATGKTLLETVEILADHFSSPLPTGGNVHLHRFEPATVAQHLAADDNFTLAELRHTLHALRKKGAPGHDGITNQALRNLNLRLASTLGMFNAIWR